MTATNAPAGADVPATNSPRRRAACLNEILAIPKPLEHVTVRGVSLAVSALTPRQLRAIDRALPPVTANPGAADTANPAALSQLREIQEQREQERNAALVAAATGLTVDGRTFDAMADAAVVSAWARGAAAAVMLELTMPEMAMIAQASLRAGTWNDDDARWDRAGKA